ncbi:MAG: hypothetical protein ACRD16_01965 [Thermoanaerobaculia bacterium]
MTTNRVSRREACRNTRTSLRFGITLLVLLSQVVVATATHHHSSSLTAEWLFDDSNTVREVHEISCANPTASHWHPDLIVEVEPCLACLRQHLTGIQVQPPARIFLATVEAVRAAQDRPQLSGFRSESLARGPPSLI